MNRSGAGLVILASLGLAVAAGCGTHATTGGAAPVGAATVGTPSAGVSGRPADLRAWTQCMRDHGIAMPDLDPRTGQPVDASAQMPDKHAPGFGEAVQACAALEPAGAGNNNRPETPEELAQKRQWAVCMREQGVPVPDPDPNDPNGPHFERMPNLPPAAVMDKALQTCEDKLPVRERPTG